MMTETTETLTSKQIADRKYYSKNKEKKINYVIERRAKIKKQKRQGDDTEAKTETKTEAKTETPSPTKTKPKVKTFTIRWDDTAKVLHRKKYKIVLKDLMRRVWFLLWLSNFDEVIAQFSSIALFYKEHRANKGFEEIYTLSCEKCRLPFQPVKNNEDHSECHRCYTRSIPRNCCLINISKLKNR
jgi:hypothetical protein